MHEPTAAIRVIQRACERLPHAARLMLATYERLVHLATRLLGHAEAAVAEAGSDILRCPAESRDLKVVNRRRSVHGDMSDDVSAHQVDQERSEPSLYDVTAEHDDDASFTPGRGDDRVDDAAKVTRDEDVG